MGTEHISSLASVHPDAIIGAEVRIDPFAVIESDVVIEDGVHVQSHAQICSGARLRKNCIIFTGASVGAVPQDLKFSGEATVAIVGERTVVRECVTIHRGTSATQQTVVGSDCLLMAYCHVAHDCVVGNNVILANGVQLGGHVHIDDWAIIGGLTGIHQFERIGQHAMVGAGFRVMKDVPPFALAGNQPLRFVGINAIGLRRRGFANDDITRITDAYRTIYHSGLNISDGLQQLEATFGGDRYIDSIIDFIQESKRGIIPPSR